ncbi:right-handed parallel beta-helix repeat-containing protein [Kiritimatiellota bacterium B12222]|nr:right-handed parallel beta-helix repeat-containing protein [Kiritimatiellota bacterium B12222]
MKNTNQASVSPVATSPDILFVSPNGDDAALGGTDSPLASIQAALDLVQPGGEVRVRPGRYYERLMIQNGGKQDQPTRVIAEPGAVIDGSLPVKLVWEPAEDIGPGVWVTPMPFDPRCVTVDGQFLTLLNQSRVTEASGAKPEWQWTTIFKAGINSRGKGGTWKGVKGLGFYFSDEQRFYLRLQDQADPSKSVFTFAPNQAAVTIDGASHLEFSGFKILNTPLGVKILNANNVVVDNCKIGPSREGVGLGKGSQDCVVKYCEIFQNPYSNYIPDADSWETWTAHKRGGWWDMRGIKIEQTQGGHEIHDNHIHHQWDGISSMGWDHWKSTAEERMGWAAYNQNLNIHHNLIEDMNDDALEPNSAEINGQWHDNLMIRTRCALRVKVIDVGPLYIYRNLFYDNREDIRLYGELELNPAEVFIYHNTSTARTAIMSNKVRGIGTPNYYIYNNLFYARQWWGNSGGSVEPNWHGDYNVFVRQGDHSAWDKTKELAAGLPQDTHSRWIEDDQLPFNSLDPLNLSLTEQSPARAAGTNLETLFGRVLPGLEASAYEREQPDAGAIPYGQAMPQIPRPRNP